MKNTYFESSDIKKITYTGLMTALVLLATLVIKVPVPFTNGYIHLGDSMIFIAAILLGWRYGAFAAGVGSALADVIGGYAHWAIPTLIIKALMGAIVGICVSEKFRKKMYIYLSIVFAGGFAIFNVILRNIISSKISLETNALNKNLLDELELNSVEELISLANRVETQLLIITVLIPLIILGLSLLVAKLNNIKFKPAYTFGFVIAGTFMVFGYYIASYIMTGNYIVPIFSLPWNMVQFIMGLIIANLIVAGLNKSKLSIPLK
ncbi:ECF transporter S component [Vallitalea guaymasensis]|uniref:ECF transporter S component n=1 Tax=Vallitalea guaymasensis TaxID=1185412 RepID=UPI000DE3241E|nr:ECF transporter S component [Vallitalea guaymasensis]